MATNETSPKFKHLNPDQLRFDPTNPRFGGSGEGKTQDELQALLERPPHFALELVDSFLENGFIDYEPLVVRKEGNVYTVVEGNRRLAALRHILSRRAEYAKKTSTLDDLQNIAVLVFPPVAGQQEKKEQRVYLGVRHLFGFREWPAESKANFLDANINSSSELERIMLELNIKKNEIRRYLVPFRLRKKARPLWEPYKTQDFWVLGEAVNRAGIKEYIELAIDDETLEVQSFDDKKFKMLLQFIYGTPEAGKLVNKRIRETRDLSNLARVLQYKRAAAVLEKGGALEESMLFIESWEESILRLRRLINELRVLLKAVVAKHKQAGFKKLLANFESFHDSVKQFLKDVKKSNV